MFNKAKRFGSVGLTGLKTAASKDGRKKLTNLAKSSGKRVASNLGAAKKLMCTSAQTKQNLESIKHLQEAIILIAENGAGALKQKKSMFGKITNAGFQPAVTEIDCAAMEKKVQESDFASAYESGTSTVGAKTAIQELQAQGLDDLAASADKNLRGIGGRSRKRRRRRKSRKKRRKSKRKKSRRKRKRSRRRRRR